jgi:HEAT repeat protein
MFLFRPPNVEMMKAHKDVNGLIKALAYQKDARIRRDAARVLGELGNPRAVESLVIALKDSDWDVRRTAAWALGQISNPRAVEPLIATLGDKNENVRRRAAEALGKIGDPRAVEPLIAALNDKDYDGREAFAGALGQIGDARAVKPLIAALRDKDVNVPIAAARALGEIGDSRAALPLVKTLRTSARFQTISGDVSSLCHSSAWALEKIGAPAIEPLIALLKDDNWRLREQVCKILGRLNWRPKQDEDAAWYWAAKGNTDKCVAIGSPAVLPLIATLEHGSLEMRSVAAAALGKIGDARTVKPLVAALGNKYVRENAVKALDKLGWQPGLDELDENAIWYWLIKDWKECFNIGSPAVEHLIAIVEKGMASHDLRMCQQAVQALGEIGDPRAIEPLIAVLSVRGFAGDVPNPEQTWYYRTFDDEWHFVWEAQVALTKIGVPAVEPLIVALKSKEPWVRERAARVLGEIGDTRAVEPLITAITGEKWIVRRAAIEALGKLGDVRAIEPLIAKLKDKDGYIRGDAAKALKKLGYELN